MYEKTPKGEMMKIENEAQHFIVHFNEKEKSTGILEVLDEKLPIFSFTASRDGSEFHIRNDERDRFTQLINTHFQDKHLSLF